MKPVRVLYVIGSLAHGGAEQQLFELSTRLDRSRFEPIVCGLNAGYDFGEAFRARGVRVIEVERRGSWDFSRLLRLRRHLVEIEPAIAHAFLVAPSRYLSLAALTLARPPRLILSERGSVTPRSAFDRRVDRALAPRAECYVVNAASVRRSLEAIVGTGRVPIEVVPNGIDAARIDAAAPRAATRARLGWTDEETVLISVGRLVPVKAIPDLIDAVGRVASGRRLRLALAGEGPERPAIEALRATAPFPVELLGDRNDVADLLAAADLFVLASQSEGFPNVVGEALLAGLPIAVTAAGGIPEIVSDGVHGRLVPVGDNAALARAIASLLDDPAGARRLAEAGRAHVRATYSVEAMVERMQALYAATLAGRAPCAAARPDGTG
jgi:glycosyltransferase involved in cell wall biosynthesis